MNPGDTPARLDAAQIWATLTLSAGWNTAVVMIGVMLLGAAAGTVGTFTILRRRALMGDVLSHAALPGICLAFIVVTLLGGQGRRLPVLLAGAVASGVAGVLVVQRLVRRTKLPEDAAMGAVLSVFFGTGFVLLSYIQTMGTGAEGGIAKFIYGQTATMGTRDAWLIGAAGLVAVAGVALLFKEFRLVAFDPDYALAQGWPVGRIDLALMGLLTLVSVIGLQAVGLIMMVALVIIPAAAARFWTERLALMTLLSALIGAVSGYGGAALSALFPRFPAGAVIVLLAGLLFLLSLLLAPARGVLPGVMRRLRLRLDIAAQHLLRQLYELNEVGRAAPDGAVPRQEILRGRRWAPATLAIVLWWLTRRGLLTRDALVVRLTPAGRAAAAGVTRNHRLWEQFLVTRAALAPSHVDRSADLVEHALSPALLADLERELAELGRLPEMAGWPSVHPIQPGAAA